MLSCDNLHLPDDEMSLSKIMNKNAINVA